MQTLNWFQAKWKAARASPINLITLSLKDSEKNKQLKSQRYQLVYERAQMYLVFNVIILLLSLTFLLIRNEKKVSFIYLCSLICVTTVTMMIMTFAARFRIACVELIFPINVVLRGIVSLLLTANYKEPNMTCMPTLLDFTIRNFNQLYFVAEVVLFWTNFYSLMVFSAAVIYFLAAERARLAKNQLKFCSYSTSDRFISAIASLPIIIPSFYALYMQTLNEIRLFITIDNMRNQQRMTLDIFEKQNEAVVLIK
jgi:hypothetical protein